MDDSDYEEDYKRLEAHLAEASREAKRTVAALRHGRSKSSTSPVAYLGWVLAAVGWLLFLGLYFQRQPFAMSETPLQRDAEVAPLDRARKLAGSAATASVSSTSSSGATASCGSSHGEHDKHDSDALLFLFMAIIVSVVILYATMFKMFHGLQHTVSLFLIGVIYSLLLEVERFYTKLGIIGRSHEMWMGIDPHLLIFTMLPALLTADAMTIDTSVAIRVAKQCVYLAGPGVLFNAFATGIFLWVYLPYNWSFMLCLTTGSILCATDPVAVVALLKELGASPTLTVQIQGESLLNDGTAIVLYLISYNMLKGENYDTTDILVFLVKTAMCAWALGTFVGMVFLEWIKLANRKLEHNSSLIQCTLTLCCAYWSFVLAEGVFGISGVLSCVAASLVLAHKMWPAIVDKEFLHTIWHMFEYLGNTVIFFLAGALTGRNMYHIPVADYIHLLVIYVVLILVRGTLLFASRPILKRLGPDGDTIAAADLLVMTWGGLRGAVGLSLAITVNTERADGEISDTDGQKVLFYVSGIAAMTLAINATTCPMLVQRLGITQMPRAKEQMLRVFTKRLRHLSNDKPHCGIVTRTIADMLDDVDHHMQNHNQHTTEDPPPLDDEFFGITPSMDSDCDYPSSSRASEDLTCLRTHHEAFATAPDVEMPQPPGRMPPLLSYTTVENVQDRSEESAGRSQSKELNGGSSPRSSPKAASQSNIKDPPRSSSKTSASRESSVSDGSRQVRSGSKTSVNDTKRAFLQNPRSLSLPKRLSVMSSSSGVQHCNVSAPNLDTKKSSLSVDQRSSRVLLGTTNGFSSTIAKGIEQRFQKIRRPAKDGNDIVAAFKKAKAAVTAIKFLKIADNNFTEILRDFPKVPSALREQEDDMLHICMFLQPDRDLQRVFVEVFLKLVCADYWKQIGGGAVPNQRDGETLLLSITLALSKGESELSDYQYIKEFVESGNLISQKVKRSSTYNLKHFAPEYVYRFNKSMGYNVFIMIMILISAFSSFLEEAAVDNGDYFWSGKRFWEGLEIYFCLIFIVEFLLKFWDIRWQYYSDLLNCFDFALILLGIGGIVITQVNAGTVSGVDAEQGKNLTEQGRLVRGARLFRVLRLMRIMRLFRLLQRVHDRYSSRHQVHSKAVSSHMQKVMMLKAFVHAHMKAQEEFVHTFCKDEQIERPEIARVLIGSQTAVNLAIAEAVQVEQSVDKRLLMEVRIVRECTDIAENLEKFVLTAHAGGVVSSKEAASILHPLHHHLEHFYRQLRRKQRGMTTTGIGTPNSAKNATGRKGGIFDIPKMDEKGQGSKEGDLALGLMNLNPGGLFAVGVEESDRSEAESKGWKILQKAFKDRKSKGDESETWKALLQGSTRATRRAYAANREKRKHSKVKKAAAPSSFAAGDKRKRNTKSARNPRRFASDPGAVRRDGGFADRHVSDASASLNGSSSMISPSGLSSLPPKGSKSPATLPVFDSEEERISDAVPSNVPRTESHLSTFVMAASSSMVATEKSSEGERKVVKPMDEEDAAESEIEMLHPVCNGAHETEVEMLRELTSETFAVGVNSLHSQGFTSEEQVEQAQIPGHLADASGS
jgi:NhaP-type Na+/H+ or K+/H+ antiporter